MILEGRGTTETWVEGPNGSGKKTITEWQPGSLMYFPPNVSHRLVNATNERVLIIATNNAPPIWNIHRDAEFIFNNDYIFKAHYSEDPEFYKFDEKVYKVPVNNRAQTRTNFYPDIINCELPLDNQRLPGYRRIQPGWKGFEYDHGGFISQYPPGRYSRGHFHAAGAVLVCLRGAGYTFNWHRELGLNPWKDGNGDQVKIIEYTQGGWIPPQLPSASWRFTIQRSAVPSAPSRTARGPKRAPTRKVAPVSNGRPTTATSTPAGSAQNGRRRKVAMPANRGETRASGGPYRFMSVPFLSE